MLTFSLGAGLAGFSGALLAPDHLDRALHGPAVRGAGLHHRRRRRRHQRHRAARSAAACSCRWSRRRSASSSAPSSASVALLLAALLIIRLMPDGISAGHPAAGSTSAHEARLSRCGSGASSHGPEDIGRSRLVLARLRLVRRLPALLSGARSASSTPPTSPTICSNIPLALGLCLLWGYCGVLSFGQVAYFGIAGYVYGIVAGNIAGQSLGPAGRLARRASPPAPWSPAIFGYFVFYARVQMWIAPILTLVLHAAARDLPRPDRGLPVARRRRCSSAATTA